MLLNDYLLTSKRLVNASPSMALLLNEQQCHALLARGLAGAFLFFAYLLTAREVSLATAPCRYDRKKHADDLPPHDGNPLARWSGEYNSPT